MKPDRYEEYKNFPDFLPFVFHSKIARDARTVARQSNWHENLEIQYCDAGRGTVLLDGVRVPFSEGETVAVNGGVIHRTDADGEELVYSCVILDSEFCRRAGIDVSKIRFDSRFSDARVGNLFAQIRAVYEKHADVCRAARLQALALQLLICLRTDHALPSGVLAKDGSNQTVKDALRYIRAHFEEKLSLEDVAKAIYVNKYVLSRRFKDATGQTVVEYVNTYRCFCAAQLLEEGQTVAYAARCCGFSNLSYFAKKFRECMGKSPKNWIK